MGVGFEHGGIFITQRELNATVLRTLKTAGVGKVGTYGAVLGGCHGGQYVPGVDQLLHDFAHAGEFFKSITQFICRHVCNRRAQLMQHQLHPEFTGLVLDDEKHLVVVGRQRFLCAQNGVKLQIVAVTHGFAEVELGFFFTHDVGWLLCFDHVMSPRSSG